MIIFDISYNSTGIWDGDRDRVRDEEEDGIGNWEWEMGNGNGNREYPKTQEIIDSQ